MTAAYVRAQIMGEKMLIYFLVINTDSHSLNKLADLWSNSMLIDTLIAILSFLS